MTAPQIAEPDALAAARRLAASAVVLARQWAEFEAACRARIAEIEAEIAADRARPHLTVVAS